MILRLFGGFGDVAYTAYFFVCVALLGELAYHFIFKGKRRELGLETGVGYGFWRLVFYVYLMLVYQQTGLSGLAWSMRFMPHRSELIPFMDSYDPVPYLLNVLMTMPLGFLLPKIWPNFRKWQHVAFIGFLFSLSIELMQLFSIRITATSDLITNTLGAVLGYMIFRLLGKKSSPFVRGEGATYLALSFVGATALFNFGIVRHLPQLDIWEPDRGEVVSEINWEPDSGEASNENNPDQPVERDYLVATVMARGTDYLKVEPIQITTGDGYEMAFSMDYEVEIQLDNPIIERWTGFIESGEEQFDDYGTVSDLEAGQTVYIHYEEAAGLRVAKRIVIWTFR